MVAQPSRKTSEKAASATTARVSGRITARKASLHQQPHGQPSDILQLVWAPFGDLGVCASGDVGYVELLEFNRRAPA
jgi:hypothetical protein